MLTHFVSNAVEGPAVAVALALALALALAVVLAVVSFYVVILSAAKNPRIFQGSEATRVH